MGLALLQKIASLFIIMIAGYVIVRCKLVRSEDSRVISLVMLYLIVPCSIISAFQIDSSPDIRSGLVLGLVAGAIIQAGLILLNMLVRKPLRLTPVEQASIIYSNSGNLIIPLVTALLGPEWVVFTCSFTCVQIVLLWSHCKSLISGETHVDIRKILLNVNMLSVFAGITLFALDVKLPSFIQDAIDSTAATIGPFAMLIIGMLLASVDLKEMVKNRRVWFVSGLRLLAVPLLCIVFLRFSGLGRGVANAEIILMITLLATSSPSASTVTQMSQIYGSDAEYACSINVITTLLCIITMPLIVTVYQFLG